jgi:hypothetical protein
MTAVSAEARSPQESLLTLGFPMVVPLIGGHSWSGA